MVDPREAKKNMSPTDILLLGEAISFTRVNSCDKSKADELRVGDLVKVCKREDSSGKFENSLLDNLGKPSDGGYRVFDIRSNKGVVRLGLEGPIREGYYFAYRFEKYMGNGQE